MYIGKAGNANDLTD